MPANIAFTGSKDKLVPMRYTHICHPDKCPIGEVCTVKAEDDVGLCKMHNDYMRQVIASIQNMYNTGVLERSTTTFVAECVVPLYEHLFKFKLLEMALPSPEVVGKTVYMHPVYKEIRATTRSIFDMWRGLGVIKTHITLHTDMDRQASMDYMSALTEEMQPDKPRRRLRRTLEVTDGTGTETTFAE